MRLRRRSPAVDPDTVSGLVDAVLTLAVTLCNAGLLSREEVAAAFGETAGQQQQCSAARKAPVAALREFFSMPVVGDRRFRIVAGGREPGEG